ncbi:hypothetical protein DPMN_174796 [Dreissena polymorpha]|uniref:Uncharacterized protein n=1 Tax=Dreissena polymorpha TaxID=45954 RepID=A0A9D4IGP2_DREPO|nr:hypothetical protein DPMN_174796 [Dreissena polymorpha]
MNSRRRLSIDLSAGLGDTRSRRSSVDFGVKSSPLSPSSYGPLFDLRSPTESRSRRASVDFGSGQSTITVCVYLQVALNIQVYGVIDYP